MHHLNPPLLTHPAVSSHTHLIVSSWYYPASLGSVSSTGVWPIEWCRGHIITENRLFLSQHPSNTNSFLVSGRIQCPPVPPMLEFCLAWACTGLVHTLVIIAMNSQVQTIAVSFYVHPRIVSGKHCFLEVIFHLWLLQPFYSFMPGTHNLCSYRFLTPLMVLSIGSIS